MTTNAVNAVIKFLTNRSGNLHEISTAINMEPGQTSTLLGGLLRSGTVTRTGRMRSYIYALAPNYRTPEQIYRARVKAVQAALAEQRRLTFAEVKNLLDESTWSTRAFLDQACKSGDLYKHGKQGIFLNFLGYEAYIEKAQVKLHAKRLAMSARYREAVRSNKPEKPQVPAPSVNVVCDECRQNWRGYQIHKIFGAGGRA